MYVNQKNGTFKNEIQDYLSHQSKFSMGSDASDFNNDGWKDFIAVGEWTNIGLFLNENSSKVALKKMRKKYPKFWFSIAKTI